MLEDRMGAVLTISVTPHSRPLILPGVMLQVQTVNGVNITAEAQKQTDLTSKVDLLEARIFKIEKIINVLLNV